MKFFLFALLFFSSTIFSQKNNVQNIGKANNTSKPKLIVGLVVDQMRWDFLYKYQNRYSKQGFNRLLNNGFSCENTFIPYAPTVTAAGHSCIYTGTVPAINGIMGNNWYNKNLHKMVYCTDDSTVSSVGTTNNNGKMSPANLLTTTITDELKLSNNFKSKVVSVCIKDRGAILPGGHTADAAFWYDSKTGNWITSSYYMNNLPQWVIDINSKKMTNEYYSKNWNTLYPIESYTLSTTDEKPYEGKLKAATNTSFPHNLEQYANKDYDMLPVTPYGNSFTLLMAEKAIENMQLGKNTVTDFLTVSLSSPDYIGHRFGPNSIEIEDTYLRLDKEIEDFLQYLDKTIGVNNYTLFLSADHGVAHIPSFLKEHNIPAGNWDNDAMVKDLNLQLKNKFNVGEIILAESNYQLYINDETLETNNLNKENIVQFIITYCEKQKGIQQAFALKNLPNISLSEPIKKMLTNGYNYKRAGDIQIILEPAWIDGGAIGTTHGLWNPYDSHIPLVWFGNGINKGKSFTEHNMTDIAPTLAAMLQIQMPNGCIGKVITEVIK